MSLEGLGRQACWEPCGTCRSPVEHECCDVLNSVDRGVEPKYMAHLP